MSMIDPREILGAPGVIDFAESAKAKQEAGERRFRYATLTDEKGKFYMPETVARALGDEALHAIVQIIRHEVSAIVRDEVTQIVQRQFQIRFGAKPQLVDAEPPGAVESEP